MSFSWLATFFGASLMSTTFFVAVFAAFFGLAFAAAALLADFLGAAFRPAVLAAAFQVAALTASAIALGRVFVASVDTWKSPVLLIHGDDDRNVSFVESINLITALRKRGVEVEQLVLPDEVHDFLRHANWVRAYRATADFFDRRLKARAPSSQQ